MIKNSILNSEELSKILKQVTLEQEGGIKTEQQIRDAIQSSGMIEKLAARVKPQNTGVNVDEVLKRTGPKSIKLTIVKGRALVGLNDMEEDLSKSLQLHVQFQAARFSTKSVVSSVEPIFNEQVSFDLPNKEVALLVDLDCPIHLVLVQKSATIKRSIIGVASVEWRKVLCDGKKSILAELKDLRNFHMTVGIIDLSLELMPSSEVMRKDELEFNLNRQIQKRTDDDLLFFMNVKEWWTDYLQIRTSHSMRLVKVFANDESGVRKPVTQFLKPITCRWLETPRHAARFVSLIDYERQDAVGESNSLDIWQDMHTFISANMGDVQDHALLLCSFFLGFHLDAYVTLGIDKNNNPHMWVSTIDLQGVVTFVEPLTGVYYGQLDKHQYRTVGCMFNANNFYANIQVVDAVERVKFKLNDQTLWKVLQPPKRITQNNSPFTFLPPAINPMITELEVEQVLKQLIEYFRHDHRLTCVWDDSLSNLCSQSLWNIEFAKLSGHGKDSPFSEDFQIGVKKMIPEGHTFKGYPISFNHTHPQKIMQSMIKNKQCNDILRSRGDMVRLALRVKVFSYCEGVHSCWVMIGSRALL